ncbi:hypothetical protein HK097_008405 [Rhizophlyctis rosea]|uniref:Chromo domain-containing protein n=1 Tax=Rhizophlyctis rosea TaxID=64517 RepID=A0AAD5X3Y5_9FUNG|nr:hypothetical protein HK097_008405 [Rhizophlyctis rosea]
MANYFKPLDAKAEGLLKDLYYEKGMMFGRDKVFQAFRSRYPNVHASRRAVNDFLVHQELHQIHVKPNQPRSSTRPISAGVTKLGSCQMDFISLPAYNGYERAVTCVDVFSRRMYMHPVKDATPESTIKALTAFLNQVYKYMEAKSDPDWPSATPMLLDNLNSSPVAPINKSPMEIERDESLHAPLSEKMMANASKKYRLQGKSGVLEKDQYVRLILPYDASGMRKASREGFWSKDIYQISAVVQIRKYMNAAPVYKIQNSSGEVLKGTYARWQLQPIPEPSLMVPIPKQVVRPGPVAHDEDGAARYEVEAIVDRKVVRGTRSKPATVLYQVRWKGWKKLTWEPAENLEGSEELIEEYEREHGPS